MKKRIFLLAAGALMLVSCTTAMTGARQTLSIEEKEKLLRERVTTFWSAMVADERKTIYEIYDPFYRAQVSIEAFVGRSRAMHHYNPEILRIDMQGNVAQVFTQYEYEVKSLRSARGTEFKQELKKVNSDETWIFIDNNWYRVYVSHLTGGTFVKY